MFFFFRGLVGLWSSPVVLVCHQTTIDLHETTWKFMLVWVWSLRLYLCVCSSVGKWMIVLYSSFNLSFCSKVSQLQGLAPAGYSGAPAKDMHSCQLLSDTLCPSQEKYPPLASYIVSSPFSVWRFYHKSLGSSFLYSSVIKASEWKRRLLDPVIVLINGTTHGGLCGVNWQAQVQMENSSCGVAHKPVAWAIAALIDAYLFC